MKSRFFCVISICMVLALTRGAYGQPAAQVNDIGESHTTEDISVPKQTMALPGEDKTVSMARATWDTGWFKAEIFKQLLEELGYSVNGPKTMDNLPFFLAAAQGETDLWVNSWFPSHNSYIEDNRIKSRVEPVGFQVKAGALQGYLVDKKSAEMHGITNLKDFKDPKIAKIFDRNGNGKADLIGCNPGWACSQEIEHHLSAYGLSDTVEQIQGDYSPMMAETIARYKRGAPVIFYTWTPNWTIGTLVPGQDVVWIEVPFPSLPEGQKHAENQITVKGITGCGTDPCAMGFPPSDIRVVANTEFLKRNPAVRRLAEVVEIPLGDIDAQNARMIDGEDDNEDIRRHAHEWIHKNRGKVDQWLKMANAGKVPRKREPLAAEVVEVKKKEKALRVVTKRLEPFVIYQNGRYTGFSIELWEKIADEMSINYELYGVNTIAKLLDEVKRGAADIAIAGIGITVEREKYLDFSHSFFESGLQILVTQESDTPLGAIFAKVFSILLSPGLLYGVCLFLIVLIIAAHIIWLLERPHNPQFSRGYINGLWQSIWWAVVTVTTVGYGDKTPKGKMGRLFALIWILAGYFVFAYFTASVTTTVTVQELQGSINGPQDLFGKKVATVERSTAVEYLTIQGLTTVKLADIEKAYDLLEAGEVDAVVFDAPVLQHYALKKGKGRVKVVGLVFKEENYGIALQADSPFREEINIALLRLVENGVYKEIHDKWFGS
jgi:ABC-type proline/glycine betaine transport system substrate-binding protein/ABC-type amino acid transport substrate-binding protein